MLYLQSVLRKGVSLGHVGSNYNLKDLKFGRPEWDEPGTTPRKRVGSQGSALN